VHSSWINQCIVFFMIRGSVPGSGGRRTNRGTAPAEVQQQGMMGVGSLFDAVQIIRLVISYYLDHSLGCPHNEVESSFFRAKCPESGCKVGNC
jgi:hypothetical protein